ncbi:hypothetical protein HDV01_005366 [Terramyces sp. JEL0728]|nr:hypothetical protein HDV01_005366 [Terramyces sp. JEL0728]
MKLIPLLISTVVGNGNIGPLGTPSGNYQYTTTLYKDTDAQVTFKWTTTTTEFQGRLTLTSSTPLHYSWVALGFGPGMLNAQMIVCHNLGNSSVSFHEHYSDTSYAPPLDVESNSITRTLTSQATTNVQDCAFTRPLMPNDNMHVNIDPNSPMTMIWAFNPQSGMNYKGKWFTHHSTTGRGAMNVILAKGAAIPTATVSFTMKQIHGFGMMATWLVLLPFGAFYARYCKSIAGWLVMKVIVQSTGIIALVTFIVVVAFSGIPFEPSRPHTVFGITIASVVGVQVVLGFMSLMGLSNEGASQYRDVSRFLHRISGFLLLISASVQIGLGINLLYPVWEPREILPWVIYAALLGIWLLLFIGAEIYFKVYVVRKDQGYSKVLQTTQPIMNLEKLSVQEGTKTSFTWATLDKAILDGKLYVVANGKYVYDISQWIKSHPGGQIILQSVAGTDISNDYFHESGYDAEEFVPQKVAPSQHKGGGQGITELTHQDILKARKRSINSLQSYRMTTINGFHLPVFNEQDWTYIQRARRTHVHTRLAVQKLASLCVGEIRQDYTPYSASENQGNQIGRPFDPSEYRRYALTKVSNETPQGAQKGYFRFRFCILFPYDIRDNQPINFLPGQAIEIQVRINGERISRFYTPISGDLNAFEVLIKIEPNGAMCQYLIGQQAGDRQFKIRGPFGNSLLPPPENFYRGDFFPETLFFFAGGSGITPFIQLINHLYLSTRTTLKVVQDYEATLSDELTISVGDYVQIIHHYYDGWCYGINLANNREGAFPVGCTLPTAPVNVILFNISDGNETMGSNVIEGAQLAFPQLITAYRLTSRSLVGDRIMPILSSYSRNLQVVVCGPNGMNSAVVDLLSEYRGPWNDNLRILGGESW